MTCSHHPGGTAYAAWSYRHAHAPHLPPPPPSTPSSCAKPPTCARTSHTTHCGAKKSRCGGKTACACPDSTAASSECSPRRRCCNYSDSSSSSSSSSSASCSCSSSCSSRSSPTTHCRCGGCRSESGAPLSLSAPSRLWHEEGEPPELKFDPTATELVEVRTTSHPRLRRSTAASGGGHGASRAPIRCCDGQPCVGNAPTATAHAKFVRLYVRRKEASCEDAVEWALTHIGRNFKEMSATDAFLLLGLDDVMHLARSKDVVCTEVMLLTAMLRFAKAQNLRKHEIRNMLETVHYALIPDKDVPRLAAHPVASRVSSFSRMLHSRLESRQLQRPKHTGPAALARNRIEARAVFNLTHLIREKAALVAAAEKAARARRRAGLCAAAPSSQTYERGPLVRKFAFVAKGYAWGVLVELKDSYLRAYLRCIRGDGDLGPDHYRASHQITQLFTAYRFRLYQSLGEPSGMRLVSTTEKRENDMMRRIEDQSGDWWGVNEPLVSPGELDQIVAAGRPLEICVDLIRVKRKL